MRLNLVLRALAVFLAVMVVALVAASKAVDPTRSRDALSAWMLDNTGYRLDSSGVWRIKLGLTPRLLADDVRLYPGGTIRRIEADLDLLPLLQRQIRVTRLVIHEPKFQIFAGAKTAKTDLALSALPDSWTSLREVKIKNGLILRRPAQGIQQTIGLHRLVVRALPGSGRRLGVDFAGDVNGRPFSIDGQMDNPLSGGGRQWMVRLKGNHDGLIGLVDGLMPPLNQRVPSGSADSVAGMDVKVSMQADDVANAVRVLGWDIPAVGPMKLTARLVGGWDKIAVPELDMVAGRRDLWRVSVRGRLDSLLTMQGVDVVFQADQDGHDASSARMAGRSGARSLVQLSGRVTGGGQHWAFHDVHSDLSGMQSRGDLAVDWSGFRPRISGQWSFDHLDMMALPTVSLMWSGLDGDLQLSSKTLVMGSHSVEKAAARLLLSPGLVRLTEMRGMGWGGAVSGQVEINHARSPASLTVALTGDGLDAGALLHQADSSLWQDSQADIQLSMASRGDHLADLLTTLRGQARVLVKPHGPAAVLRCAAAVLDISGLTATSRQIVVDLGKQQMAGRMSLDFAASRWDMVLDPPARLSRSCRDVAGSLTLHSFP